MSKGNSRGKTAAAVRPPWLIPAIIIGVLALVAAVFALVSGNQRPPYTPEVAGAPRAVVDETEIDHGSVAVNTPVESVFRIRNVGDQPLQFRGTPRVELIEGC